MSQRYNDNIKRQKPKENQLGILNLHISPENSEEGLGSRRECCWHYVSMRIHPKSCRIFPPKSCCNFTQWFKEGRNWSIAVTYLRLVSKLHANTSSPGVYRRKQLNWQAHLELCHKNPDILEGCCTGSRYQTQLHGSAHPCKL